MLNTTAQIATFFDTGVPPPRRPRRARTGSHRLHRRAPGLDRHRVAALLGMCRTPRLEQTLCRVGLELLCGDSDVAAFSICSTPQH